MNENSTYIIDIDNDGKQETIVQQFCTYYNGGSQKKPEDPPLTRLKIYDNKGNDLTDKFIPKDLQYDPQNYFSTEGFELQDVNGDGLKDIVPFNSWGWANYGNLIETTRKNKYLLLNTGKAFNGFTVDIGNNTSIIPKIEGSNIPIYLNNRSEMALFSINYTTRINANVLELDYSQFKFPCEKNLPEIIVYGERNLSSEFDSIQLKVKSFQGYKITWMKNDSVLGTSNHIFIKNPGEYWVKITNLGGCTNKQSFIITRNFLPKAPTANAGKDQIVFEGNIVSLNGSVTHSPSGKPITFKWIAPHEIGLSSYISSNPTFIAPEVKKDTFFTFFLIINDGILDSPTDTVKIFVKNLNKMPVAKAGENQIVNDGTTVKLDGSGSYDPDGNQITYKWLAPQGIILYNSETPNPTFAAPKVVMANDLIFTLYVSDGQYTSTASRVIITVKHDNHAPIANAGTNQTINEGELVYLDGSLSFDVDGDLLTFDWLSSSIIKLDWSNTKNPSFIAPQVDKDTTFKFSLIVNDGLINSQSTIIEVTVKNLIKTDVEDIHRNNLAIYPNPTSGILIIEGLPINQNNSITVYSVDGRLICKKTSILTTESIDISEQVSGTYLLNVNDKSFQIIKE